MPLAHVSGALGSTVKLLRHRIWRILTVNYGVCMETVRITEAELQQGFRALADRARSEPVTITTPPAPPRTAAINLWCCRPRNMHASNGAIDASDLARSF